MLKIEKKVLADIIAHAKRDVPMEACGYLAAREGVICSHFEMTNVDRSHDHYTLDPKEQFTIMKEARKQNIEVCAVYHSHPATPARPSAEDIKLAYDPTISYVIVSLLDQKETMKSFRIKNNQVTVETVEII